VQKYTFIERREERGERREEKYFKNLIEMGNKSGILGLIEWIRNISL
jgi:hypothetical protein